VHPSKEEETYIAFNPEDAPKYPEGVDYPASKEDSISAAETNDAPDELIELIETLGRPEFSGPEDVVEELQASASAG
jgi:Protein of unknown function (DUF2795)